ncbi:MAG: LOG family protein, partial [Bacteroidetes bacterium]|nr:LOG family protein [Bacteroidota bacterium]
IVLPGGFGTLDELFEALTLVQTQKSAEFPIILVGSSYWKGLVDWIKSTMLEEEHNINEKDLELFTIVDTAEEAVNEIFEFYSKYSMSINF